MTWHAELDLNYHLEAGRTVARHRHNGPLRILQSLYPEGDSICHNVLVHPPGGLVGGDTLDVTVNAHAGAHALVTTPGATRFYRSEGPLALQRTRITLERGARLEWLPLETLCYSGCQAENRITIRPEPESELIGWDITALGLPHANQPFVHGQLQQHIEVPGVWLERAKLAAQDTRLLDSPTGMAGQRCIASLFLVCGSPLPRERRQRALDSALEVLRHHPLAPSAGVTSPNPQVVVVRVLTPVVEPAMDLLRTLRTTWRQRLWALGATNPRIWAM